MVILPKTGLHFAQYRDLLEDQVISPAVLRHFIGREELISLNPSRLAHTNFARLLGDTISASDVSYVLDYYGYKKPSRAFNTIVKGLREELKNKQIKRIKGVIAHFSSLRLETVIHYDPRLSEDFGEFKRILLDVRGFPHKYDGR